MDPLIHFRGHNCTETNTHTQHDGLLSLYVHVYANVCVRAYMLLCLYVHVLAYTIINAHMFIQCHSSLTSLMSITLLLTTNTSATSYSTGTIASISCIKLMY